MSHLYIGGIRSALRPLRLPPPVPAPHTNLLHITPPPGSELYVKTGDDVLRGQLLALPTDPSVASVHSPVCGTVLSASARGIELRPDWENDALHPACAPFEKNLDQATLDELLDTVEATGIAAPYGEHASLADLLYRMQGKVHTVVLSAVDDQPMSAHASHLLVSYPEEILLGMKLMLRILSCQRGMIAIGKDQLQAIESITPYLSDPTMLRIEKMKPVYPLSHPRHLVLALFRVEQKRGKQLYDTGYAVFPPHVFLDLYRAFVDGLPQIERQTVLCGDFEGAPIAMTLPIGFSVSDIAKALGVDPALVLGGTGALDAKPLDANSVVTKNTDALLLLSSPPKDLSDFYRYTGTDNSADACIGCGKCFAHCPSEIDLPTLMRAVRDKKKDISFTPMDFCIECGCCTYICPCRIDVYAQIKRYAADLPDLPAKTSVSENTEPILAKNESHSPVDEDKTAILAQISPVSKEKPMSEATDAPRAKTAPARECAEEIHLRPSPLSEEVFYGLVREERTPDGVLAVSSEEDKTLALPDDSYVFPSMSQSARRAHRIPQMKPSAKKEGEKSHD